MAIDCRVPLFYPPAAGFMEFNSFKLQPLMSRGRAMMLALLFLGASVGLFHLSGTHPQVVEEDHLMEWTQAVFLLLASLVLAIRARRKVENGIDRLILAGLALLAASFLARELDIDSWGNPAIADNVETVFRVLIVVAWGFFAKFLWQSFGEVWRAIPRFLGAPVITLTFLGGCCYLASWPYEKELFAISDTESKYWGQLFQIFASVLLFNAALAPISAPVDQ